jgi:cytidylate kinase
MLLTVSGPPGSGKSTVAEGIAVRLNLEYISGGNIFREIAEERGISVGELNRIAEGDDSIDRELDENIKQIAEKEDNAVIESRLAGWMAGENANIRIWLDAPIDIRANRIANREEKEVDQILKETIERETSENHRYEEYHGIDFSDLSIYDLVIDTSKEDANGVIDKVIRFAEGFSDET